MSKVIFIWPHVRKFHSSQNLSKNVYTPPPQNHTLPLVLFWKDQPLKEMALKLKLNKLLDIQKNRLVFRHLKLYNFFIFGLNDQRLICFPVVYFFWCLTAIYATILKSAMDSTCVFFVTNCLSNKEEQIAWSITFLLFAEMRTIGTLFHKRK